jgi:hypothetical protein
LSARIHFRLIALLSLALILCSSTIASAHPLTEQKPTPPPETGAAATPAAPATMPPLPAGVPPRFTFGLSNNDAGWLTGSGVPWGMRYQYLSAGVNTGDGWATWNRNGEFATNYINESRAANTIPVFIYYQILQSAPAYDEFGNLNNPSTMRAYFDDFKLLMIKCGAAGGTIWVDLEPDLTGTMQQHETNTADNAALQPASVTASGHPDVQGYPDSFRGVYQALVHLRDLYAPNVSLGLDVSPFGASDDVVLALRDDPGYDWRAHATRTATYLNSLGPGFQALFYNPSDRDAAWYQISQGSNRWWDDTNTRQPTFDTMLNWLNTIIVQTNKRALLWQVPNGNRVYRSMDNSDGHYQDNRAEYFLNPATGRAHVEQWAAAGVVGVLFGAGTGSQAHYNDTAGDGVTNPAPINGNNAVATLPDDDGGYIRLQTAAYYAPGGVPLPGAQPPPGCLFFDVCQSDYFYTPVQYLVARGAVSGYADLTFRPGNTTTRGQLAKMVVLAEGFSINTAGGPHLRDVPATSPFYNYIETAYNRGLISGYTCGGPGEPCPGVYFRPNASVTRGQLAKIIVKAAGWPLVNRTTPTFRDVPATSPFYAAIETAAAHGVISGYTCGAPGEACPGVYFRSSNSATRGQISKILYKAVTGP